MVNRIWQHHFGEGLVRSVSNFGRMGESAESSRSTRLPGVNVCREWLVDEETAPRYHAFRHLPAQFESFG